MSVQGLTVQEVADALMVAATSGGTEQERVFLAGAALPHTEPEAVADVVAGIREFVQRADIYAKATPKQARAWFCDPDCDHGNTAEALAECLHERAEVWKGEAKVLALNAASRDAKAVQTIGGKWVQP